MAGRSCASPLAQMCACLLIKQNSAETRRDYCLSDITCQEKLAGLRHELQVDDLADLDSSGRGKEVEKHQHGKQGPRDKSCHCC